MKKEYDLSKGRVRKGPVANPRTTKVQISIRLDGEILQHFIAEAARSGIPYQTLINSALKLQVGNSGKKRKAG